MERVQWNQEEMIAELKDLQQKRIFSPQEIQVIFKTRTDFELALIKRSPQKRDYLAYIEYENALENLRKKRVKKLKTSKNHSLSDHSIVQRQYSIFERATRRFKSDVRLWVQYIEVALKNHANQLAGRICARALKLHPDCIALYVLAAQQELNAGSSSAARSLLQRGIRLNPESIDIWTEYVKMEINFVETLRRRWEVLGIDGESPTADIILDTTEQVPNGEAARESILKGAIIKAVIDDATSAIPRLELFKGLLELLKDYPSPLSHTLHKHVYDLLLEKLKKDPRAHVLHANQYLNPSIHSNLNGPALVDALKRANEELQSWLFEMTEARERSIFEAYATWIMERFQTFHDPNLRLYLLITLHNTCIHMIKATQPNTAADYLSPLLATHLRLLQSSSHSLPAADATKLIKIARKYSLLSTSTDVWLERLEVERSLNVEASKVVWDTARRTCKNGDLPRLWGWGLKGASLPKHEALLKESLSNPTLHENLFLQTITYIVNSSKENTQKDLSRIFNTCLPTTTTVYHHAFELVAANQAVSNRSILQMIYDSWSRLDKIESSIKWARWLLLNGGDPKAASNVILTVSKTINDLNERQEFETRWRRILDGESEEALGDVDVIDNDNVNDEIDNQSPKQTTYDSAEDDILEQDDNHSSDIMVLT